MPRSALQNRKENKMKKYTSKEKRAYYIGFGEGLEYPSGKVGSYSDSLSAREKKSFLNGFYKSKAIKPSNCDAFRSKKKR